METEEIVRELTETTARSKSNTKRLDEVEAGYLPIIRSDMPEREGYYYTPAFHYEDSSIVEFWIEHENPPEEPSYEELLEAVEIYKGGDFDE